MGIRGHYAETGTGVRSENARDVPSARLYFPPHHDDVVFSSLQHLISALAHPVWEIPGTWYDPVRLQYHQARTIIVSDDL
jgi:hypothetical protein